MRTKNWKETLKRAGRTFLQTFVGTLAATFSLNAAVLKDPDAFTSWAIILVSGAIAAAVAAVMNLPKKDDTDA